MEINKTIHEPIRLKIMSLLLTHESFEFKTLKLELNLTDGNLSSHLKKLETENYIQITKSIKNKKTNTKIEITDTGKKALLNHIEFLENIIKQSK